MPFNAFLQAVAATTVEAADKASIDYSEAGLIIAAMAAVGTAAFGIVDASKALWGGVSNVGFGHIENCLKRFDKALASALPGQDWRMVFRAHWRNGVAKEEQKTLVRSLLRLGMRTDTVDELAEVGHLDPKGLAKVVAKLEKGAELEPDDLNILGRLDASMAALVDAAFERADQQYRNVSKVLAGVVAVGLTLWANRYALDEPVDWALAWGVGLLAVPVAPLAKDLTSALSTTVRSIKAVKSAVL